MDTNVGFYFKKISEKIEKKVNFEKKHEVTYAQGKLLWYLHKRGEKVPMRDAEQFFDCSHATISGLVSRLEEKGFISVETDEKDRRAKLLVLTEKENRNFREMQKRRRDIEEMLLQNFTEEEKKEFSSYLERVYKNLG